MSSATAQRLPVAQGMVSAAVCVRVDVCDGYVALPEVRFKRKSQKYPGNPNFLSNLFRWCQASLTLLNRCFLLNIFP